MTRVAFRRWLVGAAMVLAVASALPGNARADWDDRPEPGEFEESLNPYGYWVDAPGYGRVWRPNEDWNWRPYVDGQWVWTSYGWTWSSPEPWGWTFHYGRWGWANTYGWVWTPGYTWGPAWVDWYWGDGYVGWVPLAPAGFVVTPGYWNYVRDYSFCSPHVHSVVELHDRLPSYIVHHRDQGWGRQREPDFRDIEQVSRHRIVRENDRPTDSVAPWVRHRIDRGERVRERIDDRGRERVIEHAGRQTNLQGPNGRDRDRPAVSNDDWRHRGGNDDEGEMLGRNRGQDDRELTGRTFEHRNRDDDARDNRPEVVDVPRRPGHEGGQDRRVGPRVDDDRELTRPPRVEDGRNAARPRVSDDGAWSRPQPNPDVRVPRVDRAPSPGVMYRGGGGGAAPGGAPGGGPMVIERNAGGGMGGGRAAGPTMQHGGGGGAPSPSPAPGAGSGASMSHGGGGGGADRGGGGGSGGRGHSGGGVGSQGGVSQGGASQGGGSLSR